MGRTVPGVVIALVALGCGAKEKSTAGNVPAATSHELEGPIRVAIGDCAGTDIGFVSGPRPMPFDPARLVAAAPAEAAAESGRAGLEDVSAYGGVLGHEIGDDVPSDQLGWGSGTGRGMPNDADGPVEIGGFIVNGSLDKNIIRRYVRRSLTKLRTCYANAQRKHETLAGTVEAKFTIARTGKVTRASTEGVDAELSTCVADVIRAIWFPRPIGNNAVSVVVQISFRSTAAAEADLPDPASYRPGARSPLAPIERELAACFRQQARPYGVMVIDLSFDASGKVTAATAHGIDSATVRSCAAQAARGVTRGEPGPTAQRCAVAFGAMPITDAPGVDLSPDRVAWNDKTVADSAEPRPDGRIDALYEAARANRASAIAPPADVPVAIRGPVIVRPVDATPMNMVNRALVSVQAAGDDPILAAQNDRGWRLLRAVELPVVPIPAGTGGSWNRPPSPSPRAAPMAAEHTNLSLLVTANDVWIGESRVGEIRNVQRAQAGHDWKVVAGLLAELKSGERFTDRSDIEIAGDADALYADVVRSVDLAAAAGFTQWKLVEPNALSVRFFQ